MSRQWHTHLHRLRGLPAALLASATLAGCVQYTTAVPQSQVFTSTPTPFSAVGTSSPAIVSRMQGLWALLSMEEDGYAHLFALDLASSKLTRLTSGYFQDVTPAMSPDGTSIVFASNRGGSWDLYSMELQTAVTTQVTDTPEYDGSPVWSPDKAWLAYETYDDGQLDVAIKSMTDPAASPVLLTGGPAADHSPAWSPDGRRIAFVSTRTGNADIWLADLDKTSDKFTDLSQTPRAAESHPAWSRDGVQLAWATAAQSPDLSGIHVWDTSRPVVAARWTGSGTWPAWSADGTWLAAVSDSPTQQFLGAYALSGAPLTLPTLLPGTVQGLVLPTLPLPDPLPDDFRTAAQAAAPSVQPASAVALPEVPSKRWHIVALDDVQAPAAGLHALVAPSFAELRERVIAQAGWDPLASLENTFVPFTTPLEPGLEQDWLYTGRAFAFNTLMLNAGWMAVVRQDISDQTYWRVYVRTRNQDGSQGTPLKDPPWDLNSRYQLDPRAYEAGGDYAAVPSGYWFDFTSLAQLYGWQRLPALQSWRTYYGGARFSEFANTGGLDWYSAMLELYPADALITPTVVLPPSVTPTRTPRPTPTPYPTSTPRDTLTPSITPTPLPPTSTRTPTSTPTRTNTPLPSATPPTVIPTFPSSTP